jgi:nicotinate-nucleotide pyrophosphorylase (carboxylating)
MTNVTNTNNICSLQVIKQQVTLALLEDTGVGVDYTGELIEPKVVSATIITRQDMVLCGEAWVNEAFLSCDPQSQITWYYTDGDRVKQGSVLCQITGLSRSLLTAERTALNFLQCLSATATVVASYVARLNGYATKLMDTRKTIPGLRLAQKYAVTVGGGYNQRYGLYDGVLIKENHIASSGGIKEVLTKAHQLLPSNIPIQIEVESFGQLELAINCGAKLILLDNMSLQQIKQCVDYAASVDSGIELEASGNINLNNVLDYAKTGVQRISIGALTKNILAIDLSMRITNCG